ncbi:MAG: class I tRNA ligase family protein [Alphaproteobacteria bacterium]|nr:class I tRNA ligase family protein [Alphaproteobacteria bacterium]
MSNSDESKKIQPILNPEERETSILSFWYTHHIFERSQDGIPPETVWQRIAEKIFGKKEYVFFDGPPFATGLPHMGHILAGAIKDSIARYKTMRGFIVKRRWGWDCHGLPVEQFVEQELGINKKEEIEKLGIGVFNAHARKSVLTFRDEWKKFVDRMGRFVDMENDYKTMDTTYMLSVWHIFSLLFKKGLVHEGHRVMQYCPRCETTLSNNEVSEGYKDVTDITVTVSLPTQHNVSLVVWTTTPWTLPGNMAVAMNKNIEYVRSSTEKGDVITSKKYAEKNNLSIKEKVSHTDLLQYRYTPPFAYTKTKSNEKCFKVYHADFVTEEGGTGLVHIAPCYGADDYALAKEHLLPIEHHITTSGCFIKELEMFHGMEVKKKDDTQSADIEVIKYLAHVGSLFAKEKIVHSYPHCWRCKVPLLNYALSTWFIDRPAYKQDLIDANKTIHWVPDHIRDGRFGNLLVEIPEWAFARTRFWGTAIPIWKNDATGKIIVIDGIQTLKQYLPKNNTVYVVRHGEAENNIQNIHNISDKEKICHLTEKGRKQAHDAGVSLKNAKIDYIITSPLTRTRETAQAIAEAIGYPTERIIVDIDLQEVQAKIDNMSFASFIEIYEKVYGIHNAFSIHGVESKLDVYMRTMKVLKKIHATYKNKNILIVSHASSIYAAQLINDGLPLQSTWDEHKGSWYDRYSTLHADPIRLEYRDFPTNEKGEIDFHRPYVDTLVLTDTQGNSYTRIKEVFDCWFESGAMPYAQHGYPDAYSSKDFNPKQHKGFPADFIAEGLDQTRGWFNSLLAVGVGAFNETPYKSVIVNGLVLDPKGKKMSKSEKNYTSPMELFNMYSADAVRHYMLNSPVVRGENLLFEDEGVSTVAKKMINRLLNCVVYYTTYANFDVSKQKSSVYIDTWIMARLERTADTVTKGYEDLAIDEAVHPLELFIDDLSTWYVRRCRDRLKENSQDGAYARGTLQYVLLELSKLMAPSMPFVSEHVYQILRTDDMPVSVHLCRWPSISFTNTSTLERMALVRGLVSEALEARASAGIKVRQPLASLTVPVLLSTEEQFLLLDELNVKEIKHGHACILDTTITKELFEEGILRDTVRSVQDLRKKHGCSSHELIESVEILSGEVGDIIGRNEEMFLKEVRAKSLRVLPLQLEVTKEQPIRISVQ